MSIWKKILFIVLFIVLTAIAPAIILLFFVDALHQFSVYVIWFVIVIFGIWGYIIITMRGMSKELHDAVESMKMQNAAIAFKLTNDVYNPEKDKNDKKNKNKKDTEKVEAEEKIDIMKVNLNPEEPLVPTKAKSKTKKVDDNYDDFK